jgi:hypothetical protein
MRITKSEFNTLNNYNKKLSFRGILEFLPVYTQSSAETDAEHLRLSFAMAAGIILFHRKEQTHSIQHFHHLFCNKLVAGNSREIFNHRSRLPRRERRNQSR